MEQQYNNNESQIFWRWVLIMQSIQNGFLVERTHTHMDIVFRIEFHEISILMHIVYTVYRV